MPSCHKCGQQVIGDNIQCDDCREEPADIDEPILDENGFYDDNWLGSLNKVVRPKEKYYE